MGLVNKKSKIHGIGIFTDRAIKKREIIHKIEIKNVEDKPHKRWAHIGNNKWLNDPKILNWINHSCDSNIELNIKEDQVILVAKKDIQKGEELTCDYNKTETNRDKIPCNCKSKKCKKEFSIIK